RSAAAVGCFPYTATDRPAISHDAAIGGGRRIDRDRVDSSFSRSVIITVETTGHPLGLRTQRREIGRAKRVSVGKVKREMSTRRDAACHPCMLHGGGAQPCRIEAAGRICQATL